MAKRTSPVLTFGSLLAAISTFWLAQVNATVKAPYLDEFFHVWQALAYWQNQWRIWDPKITTPPGLYIVSYIGLFVTQWLPTESLLSQLRAHNVVSILLVFMVLNQVISARQKGSMHSVAHTAFNMCMFPPLFFFCGLYYTDVMSVLVVMMAHKAFYDTNPAQIAIYSLLSLWFRQTNIFWTAVYLGGSEVLRQIKSRQKRSGSPLPTATFLQVAKLSWSKGVFYDLPVVDAYLEDYVKVVISLPLSALSMLQDLIAPLLPYISTLAAFTGFIIWNGSVVLGDKENHVASLHLPQMLYIWPYISFFSWPVILPSLCNDVLGLLPTSIGKLLPLNLQPRKSQTGIRLFVILPALLLALAVIHYNTLIHPFTLADNRHYTFYVFRLLRRNFLVIYLLAPAYLFFAWVCIGALSMSGSVQVSASSKTISSQQMTASWLLLWLATSTLSLATAPLVEPRYFILPWIMWRLNVTPEAIGATKDISTKSSKKNATHTKERPDQDTLVWWLSKASLPAETLWHLMVNAITAWIFLNKGFTWPNEPGEIMRFMW